VAYFNTSSSNHQGHITVKKTGMVVMVTSLDDFLIKKKSRPDFIKIDVEGGEAGVLNGFSENIALLYPTIILELHNTEQAKKVADFFRPLDYFASNR
jgi:FkbM family methyltransferase